MKTQNLSDISIQYLKGVGPQRKKVFERLGVETVEDLLYFFPRRYEDRRQMTPLAKLKIGEWQTVTGKILNHSGRRSWYTKKHVYEMELGDETSRVFCVWFNRPYLDRYFKLGQQVIVYGKVDLYKDRFQIVSPDYEIITDDEEDKALSVGRIVPVYPMTRGMTQRSLRKSAKQCLEKYVANLQDVLPYSIRKKYALSNLVKSLWNIHFPESLEDQVTAYRRVSFEEFFLFQISVLLRRQSIVTKDGIAHAISDEFCRDFERLFSFVLTQSQKDVIKEVAKDLKSNSPMHRLLQGDVGCGKTVVAFFGCLVSVRNGHQAAIMAPTEILARQHYENLLKVLSSSPFSDVRACLLISDQDTKSRARLLSEVQQGTIDIVIGTHALIQDAVNFRSLSFVVIDEQHKFGVRQRALLSAKGKNPDVLVMTATPIPRTLCLTLYGDLDVSTINEIPPGRGNLRTALFAQQDAGKAYEIVRQAVARGEQAYIVYPIIDESEDLDLKSAQEMYKTLQKGELKGFRLGLLHGQMKKQQTQDVMRQFLNKELDVLVATTVLEVGVDVPNATVMVVEHADRFGLAQLHQLRGRIGRGALDAQCVLTADLATPQAQARLEVLLSTRDGFQIAQQDLLIRGPGEFFGRHQHGLNELRIANPQTQLDILEEARQEAIGILAKDPKLSGVNHAIIQKTILTRYPSYLGNILSG